MTTTSFETVVVNGQIQLPNGIALPENARIKVTVTAASAEPVGRVVSPRLADPSLAADFTMQVVEPPDASI